SEPDDLPLAAEFPAATRAQWLALVERVLKGAPFDTLTSHSADGLAIDPLHARAPQAARAAAPARRWQVMGRGDHPGPAKANAQALEELEGGANGLVLVGADSIGSHGYGLMPDTDTFAAVLEGVHLDAGISIEVDVGAQTALLPFMLARMVHERK